MLLLFTLLAVVLSMLIALRRELHFLQLNSYRVERYLRWAKTNIFNKYYYIYGLVAAACLGTRLFRPLYWAFCLTASILVGVLFFKRKEKVALVWTPRARRIFMTSVVLAALVVGLQISFAGISVETAAMVVGLLAMTWVLVVVATLVLQPVETAINNAYISEASNSIQSSKSLKVIGVTGSYGKTSTKSIIEDMLGEYKNVLATPKSFNTTLGVVRTIREKLSPLHEIFIVEMGARQQRDIKEICEIVHPQIGVITSIGEQHLEYFKTVENILRTKCELLHCLQAGGTIILNGDDENLATVEIPAQIRVLRYGLDAEGLDVKAEAVSTGDAGSTFTIRLKDGRQWDVRLSLLGKHNISNVLAGMAVGLALDVPMEHLVKSIKRIKPVQHRLELIRSPGGLVIDDSYNSNPKGAGFALEVLGSFAGYRKILVTPGMIELGDREGELNASFGRQAAAICDYIILVGKDQTRAIADGISSTSFPANHIYVARNFQDATAHLNAMRTPTDIVLYENDLPDTHEKV